MAFSVIINDICSSIKHSRCLFLADSIKIFHTMSSVIEHKHLKTDIDFLHVWWINHMKINTDQPRVITFTQTTFLINCN